MKYIIFRKLPDFIPTVSTNNPPKKPETNKEFKEESIYANGTKAKVIKNF